MKLWNYEDGSELPSSKQRTGRLNKLAKQRKGARPWCNPLSTFCPEIPDPAARRTALGLLGRVARR
ncbi:MAG: hypothetical protein U1E43_03120 [Rhodospirillales bacterium]